MAPSPENDSTPKAPDKLKQKTDTNPNNSDNKGISSEEVTSLDDGQLKALLDEAISYKTPRDKEGKSELFKSLLTDAEDDLRKSTAKSASGSELARYYSTTANQRHRNKRQPSSISETHGGSLNDLVKEELYQSSNLPHRQLKTVSARQREGGSLPCDVNVGSIYDKEFFLNEFSKRRTNKMDSMETTSLLEDDSISQEFNSIEAETVISHAKIPQYITNATLQIGNVEDTVMFPAIERSEKASTVTMDTVEESLKQVQDAPHQFNLLPISGTTKYTSKTEEKKVDENGNAVGNPNSSSGDGKKRKKPGKKVEDFMKAEDVVGHRADIINDIPMLLEFISGSGDKQKGGGGGGGSGGGGMNKTKLSHKTISEEKNKHKQRTRSSKGAKGCHGSHRLQKSTSMEEISTTKMEMDFHFHDGQEQRQESGGKIPLRTTKSNAERPRERNWVMGSELYQNASAENLENADFTFVTKKKKSKKRRNSLGSRKQGHATEKFGGAEFQRLPSPHRKSACSVPHSEKSNDSSDADSVHSLPFEESLNNLPVSYADIAKSAERPKWNRPPSERKKSTSTAEKTTNTSPEKSDSFQSSPEAEPPSVPAPETHGNNNSDLSSLQNWPEIMKYNKMTNSNKPSVVATSPPNNSVKNSAATPSPPTNNNENSTKIKSVNRTNKTTPPPPNVKNNNKIKLLEENHDLISTPVRENNIFNNHKQPMQEKPGGGPMYHQMYQMPPNIRDVQSIEKMQLKNLQGNYQQEGGGASSASSLCETEKRPAVVILSGGDKKHVTDITFGFDINEQLLNGDVCTDFISRFVLPDTPKIVHIDKLVHYIGTEWEDVVVQINSGKVKYYTETYNYSGLI